MKAAKLKMALQILVLSSIGSHYTFATVGAEKQRPWTDKCKSKQNFYYDESRKDGYCPAPKATDSKISGFQDLEYTGCAQGSTPSITIRYNQLKDDESKLYGAQSCIITEIRNAKHDDGSAYMQRNVEIIYSTGTRKVISFDDTKGEPEGNTLYTKDGMVTCDTWDVSKKQFKWCGVVDPDRPSTQQQPYGKADGNNLTSKSEQALLAGTSSLKDVFPIAAPEKKSFFSFGGTKAATITNAK